MNVIEVNGISIEIIKKKIKNLILRVYPDGSVKLSTPMRYSNKLIQQHLGTKTDWIETQIKRIQNTAPKEELLDNGSNIPFLGHNYLLLIKEHEGAAFIQIEGQLMHCFIQPHASFAQKQTLLDNWYQAQMKALLPDLLTHWEAIIGVKASQWTIKKMKSRWGSCNTRTKKINLNLNLIKKPLCCLEYVLVHELVHILEASHNHRFYRLMTQFMPQWREYQYLLEGKYKRS